MDFTAFAVACTSPLEGNIVGSASSSIAVLVGSAGNPVSTDLTLTFDIGVGVLWGESIDLVFITVQGDSGNAYGGNATSHASTIGGAPVAQ